MDGIFEQSRLQLIDLKANVEKQNAMLEPLLSANPPDTTKAMAQIDKVAEARAELEKADAKMLLGIRGVLTPDQWTKLHEARSAGGTRRAGADLLEQGVDPDGDRVHTRLPGRNKSQATEEQTSGVSGRPGTPYIWQRGKYTATLRASNHLA